MAYRHLPVEPPAKPPADTHLPGVPDFNRMVVLILAMFLLILASGCGQNAAAGTGKETAAVGSSQGKSTIDSTAKQQDKIPSQLEQADAYFRQGSYEAALDLYRGINTDYAQRQAHAIECITVSQEVAQEWLNEVDDDIANGIILAAFGLDFEFDTDYDVSSYTFYTKMVYPSFYTSVASLAGVSQSELEEGVTSSGHEKIAYRLFYDRGYKDITCVSQMLDSDGNVLASYPYGQKEYESALAIEQKEAAEKAQETAAQESRRAEFINSINSNEELQAAIYAMMETKTETIASFAYNRWINNMTSWPYETMRDFELVDVTYGSFLVDDSKVQQEVKQYCYKNYALSSVVVIHLPCIATVRAFAGTRDTPKEQDTEVKYELQLDAVFLANPNDPDVLIFAEKHELALISMEEITQGRPADPSASIPAGQEPDNSADLEELTSLLDSYKGPHIQPHVPFDDNAIFTEGYGHVEVDIQEIRAVDENTMYVDLSAESHSDSGRVAEQYAYGTVDMLSDLVIKFDDDGWGNSGVLKIYFLDGGRIGVECEITEYSDDAFWSLEMAYTELPPASNN